MVPQGAVDAYSVAARLLQGKLQGAEEASGAGDSDRDEPEFPQDLLPPFVADAPLPPQLFEDLGQSELAVRRELQGLPECINDPSQDDLAGGPAAVPLEQFLEGYGLLAVPLSYARLGEDIVDSVEQVSPEVAHAPGPSLA